MKLKKSLLERLEECSKNLERLRKCKNHNAQYITRRREDHWWLELKPCSNCEEEKYQEYLNK